MNKYLSNKTTGKLTEDFQDFTQGVKGIYSCNCVNLHDNTLVNIDQLLCNAFYPQGSIKRMHHKNIYFKGKPITWNMMGGYSLYWLNRDLPPIYPSLNNFLSLLTSKLILL